ncbi:hypothetical protein U2I53_22245 [Lysinibacillus capsici]|uniref:hypothetical protein n=1 Tax=Lysinibacillus capsici TaxID=2115968 RepID=UPI0032DF8216
MAYNSSVFDNTIKLAMRNQSVIEGRRISEEDIIVIALHDLIGKQEKVMNKYCAEICK